MLQRYVCGIVLLLCLPLIAFATESATNTTPNTATTSVSAINVVKNEYLLSQMTHSIFDKFADEQQKEIATLWSLTVADYQRYLWLMQYTPSGVYYHDKNLDPNWILGMNATSEQDRQKFVVIALKNERERVSKELVFQREFTRLAKALYPNEKPISLSKEQP